MPKPLRLCIYHSLSMCCETRTNTGYVIPSRYEYFISARPEIDETLLLRVQRRAQGSANYYTQSSRRVN